MDFTTAVQTCFSKYADFSGRAKRSEFWFFVLFAVVLKYSVDIFIGSNVASGMTVLGLLIPLLAVAARRLHDTDRSAWWLLVLVVPAVGWLIVLFFSILRGDEGPNDYGSDPMEAAEDAKDRPSRSRTSSQANRSQPDKTDIKNSDEASQADAELDPEANEENPWVKIRREKEAAAKKSETAAEKTEPKEVMPKKKRVIEPPRFGRDAAKKDK